MCDKVIKTWLPDGRCCEKRPQKVMTANSLLFVLFGRKEDMKVVGVLVDVQKDGLRVTSIVTDTLDGRRVKVPAVKA